MTGRSIEAVLRLNTVDFDKDIERTQTALTKFRNSMTSLGKNSSQVSQGIQTITQALSSLLPLLKNFTSLVGQTKTFNDFSKGLLKMSQAVANLSNTTNTSQVGMIRIKEIMNAWSQAVRGLTVNIRGLNTAETGQTRTMKYLEKELLTAKNDLSQMALAINRLSPDMLKLTASEERAKYITAMLRKEFQLTGNAMVEVRAKLLQMEGATLNLGKATLLTATDMEKFAVAEKQVSASSTQASNSMNMTSQSATRTASSMSRATTQTSRLRSALGSLRSMGMLVGSMIAYNFIHNLGVATTETINAKSEMEGYFKMLHFGTTQVDGFNKALDETVKKFPRLNKYALGETISSIGVEFNLTTKEMEKAMPVVSMITSEYLRAGRNVNEASLAVKDILQGEFQRLSRETGVKSKQLEEAGWSGDKNDVMGLLDALEKVGKSRHWDIFVTKANSLNDAVLILQNRFSEWSADMVNAVQPTILTVFNNLLSVAEGFAQGLGSVWEFLNSGTWESTAVNIGLVGGALVTVSQALVMYRSGLGLVEASQLGVKKSIASLVLGLKAEQVANTGVMNTIKAKILGLKADQIAEYGLTNAVRKKVLAVKQDSVMTQIASAKEQLSIAIKEESALATELKAVQTDLDTASKEGNISATEAQIIKERLHTISQELNTGATLKQTIANEGLTATLYMLGTGEAIVTGETSALSIAWGVLNGVFMLSPIGWITGAILALAGAIFVLTGGLDPAFDKMKRFNEIMSDTGSAQTQAHEYLEQVKKDAGETSEEFRKASDEVEEFDHRLQSASYWYNHAETEFNGLDLTVGATSKDVLKDYGISDEQVDKWNSNLDVLNFGKKKYYKAEQVLNKQIKGEQSNYAKDLDAYLSSVEKSGGDLEDAYGRITGNYENLAMHSYIANTSDDWWERSWNQLYAGMDQFWIDWDKFWADTGKQFAEGDILGLLFGEGDSQQKKDIIGFGKWLEDGWKSINDGLASWQKGAVEFLKPLDEFGDEVNKFLNDPLGYLGVQQHLDNVWKEMIEPLIKGITEDLPNYISDSLGHWGEIFDGIKKPLEDAWNGFWSFDWLNFGGDGGDATGSKTFDIVSLIKNLFGFTEGIDITSIMDLIYNNVALPIMNVLNQFFTDPVGMIGEMGFTITSFLDNLLGTDLSGIWMWAYTTFVQPIGDAIWNGIQQIPIISDIVSLLGLLTDENVDASAKGRAIANWIGTGITSAIGQIPIVGDILRMLGLIPSTESDAKGKGQGVGKSIDDGTQNGMGSLGKNVVQEFQDALSGIGSLGSQAYNTAKGWADQLWQGVNSVLDRHSPGMFSKQIGLEFGTDIPNAINDSSSTAYTTAQSYAQNMYNGMNSVSNTGFGLGGVVDEYQTDAQNIAMSSEMMGTDTTNAFNSMTMSVNASTNQMQSNVTGTYSQIQSKQASSLNSMKTQNISAYNDMYLKSNQSLLQMRDSTSNVTHQMTGAWSHMKDQIVASANRLKHDSTVHFNQLSSTIGTFYGKIQNPSRWGAGSPTASTSSRPNRRVGRAVASTVKHGFGGRGSSTWKGSNNMTIASLKKKICPNGNCGELFDGFNNTDVVNVSDFFSLLDGEFGFGGWSNWNGTHYNHIKNKSDQWGMKSPNINLAGGISTNANYKVGEFENGTPKISFSSFQSMAESIFSAIPYRFYYDSSWKGSWLGALQAGACNCFDGANALLAFASTCGFSGYMAHGKWVDPDGTTYPHVYAVINGKKMDTTGWQQRGSWSAGSPNVRTASTRPPNPSSNKTVNISVEITGTVYGVDDLDNKIQESVKKGLQEEFNDPFTVSI